MQCYFESSRVLTPKVAFVVYWSRSAKLLKCFLFYYKIITILTVLSSVCLRSITIHTILVGAHIFTWYLHDSNLIGGRLCNKMLASDLDQTISPFVNCGDFWNFSNCDQDALGPESS